MKDLQRGSGGFRAHDFHRDWALSALISSALATASTQPNSRSCQTHTATAFARPSMASIDHPLWVAALGLALGDAFAIWWLGWSVAWNIPVSIIAIVAGFAAIGWAARYTRFVWLSAPLFSLAVLVLLINAAWIATFVTTSVGAPLRDTAFVAADQALGFSWPSWVAWSSTHSWFDRATEFTYAQHYREAVILAVLLSTPREGGANAFLRALLVTFLVTLAISVVTPAIGPSEDAPWVPAFNALRSGSLTRIDHSEALISMPSYHAVVATLSAIVWWRIPWARWPGVGFNMLMLVGTARWGHHYLVDILAGVILALGAAWATGLYSRRRG